MPEHVDRTVLCISDSDNISRWGPVSADIRGSGYQEGEGGGRRAVHLPRHGPRHRGDGGARHRASGDVIMLGQRRG